ncbi:hypothetical protein [Micromonospora sp. NPDC005652]|uniref:hypothetical protein n=1 Tax=Micromonospora sp. NPDC005652 TaxID=3157046 RepID=UPI0033D3DD63
MTTTETSGRDQLGRPTDIHGFFNLTYAAYLTLRRDLLESSPVGSEILDMIAGLHAAFAHIEVPQYRVLRGDWVEAGELDEAGLKAAGLQLNTPSGEPTPTEEDVEFFTGQQETYTDGHQEYEAWEQVFVPAPDGHPGPGEYVVVSRTLLQSMPATWQAGFVDLLYRHHDRVTADDGDADTGPDWDCKIEAGEWTGHTFAPRPGGDPVPHYDRGRAYVEPRL